MGMPLRHHVFFSYAHVNNQKLPGRDLAWMDALYSSLRGQLVALAGRDDVLEIWHDSALRTNQRFDPAIEGAILQSALFVAVLSRAYIDPQCYCSQELGAFAQNVLPGIDQNRLFTLLIDDLKPQEWPAYIQGTSPIPFFRRIDARGATQPLAPPGWLGESAESVDKIAVLANDLWLALKDIAAAGIELPHNRPPRSGGSLHQDEDGRPAVFLGDVTDDLLDYREMLANALTEAGYAVQQSTAFSKDVAALKESAGSRAAGSVACVFLLSALGGRKPEGSEKGFIQIQAEAALERTSRKPFIWVPPEVDPALIRDRVYRSFLEGFLGSKREGRSFELWQGDIVELKAGLLESLQKQSAAPAVANPGFDPSVYISYRDTANAEADRVERISRQFEERDCTVTVLNHAEDTRVKKLHPSFLRLSDGMVIVYGPETREWAEELAFEADYQARSRQNHLRRLGILPSVRCPFGVRSSRFVNLNMNPDGSVLGVEQFLQGLSA